MTFPLSRRDLLKTAATAAAASLVNLPAANVVAAAPVEAGWIIGKMTGAEALVEALLLEGTDCVFGIPGAQENELWDTFKSKGLGYLLVTNEFSASIMADGVARATGKPGVICIIPGPGITNALTGIGEALLDSIPMVVIAGDVARGEQHHPFQVHDLANVPLLRPVCKKVIDVHCVADIPDAVRKAFQIAMAGEPGPVGVVVPYNFLMESCKFSSGPPCPIPFELDKEAFNVALDYLARPKLCWGIFAGLGCMNYSEALVQVAEILQAPVATTVSGKGVISDCHPLAVGWGYGPQGTRTAEHVFKHHVDGVLVLGARYSEVTTAFYNIPKHRHVIQVDANPHNLGRVVPTQVCVAGDCGLFLDGLIAQQDKIRRPTNGKLVADIHKMRATEYQINTSENYGKCGIDPMLFLLALRQCLNKDALVYSDATMTEHWLAEAFPVWCPRTYFNPTDNQAMGWSLAAAMGAQRVLPGKQVVTVTGDGSMLMAITEISTAVREGLPVKFFILDDQAYHYMQALQKPAYRRTTATILAGLDYEALARGFGVGYLDIGPDCDLDAAIRGALALPGPVLVRVRIDYGKRPCRWLNAARDRFVDELSNHQKVRFLSRIAARSLHHQVND